MDNPAISISAGQQLDDSTPKHDSDEAKVASQSSSTNGSNGLNPATSPKPPSKNGQGWRRVVHNFSPSWFATTTTGTGVVAVIFSNIPFEVRWLYWMSIIFFALNTLLFSLALGISILRYTIWPEIWVVMVQDPNNSLFLGTVPMGFATLIEMWIHVCVPARGEWAAYLVLALWIVDCIVAVAVPRSLDSITAAQLLPIAATIIAAGAGSEVASSLPNPQLALGVIIASYVLWGMATPIIFTVLVICYQRLALHKMPPREAIVSAFLPLGPLGFGGFTILNLGKRAADVFPKTGTLDPLAGRIAYILGFFVALIMWGWGLLWFSFAIAALWKTARDGGGIPVNRGWWGFTFPLGVYSSSTILTARELPSLFFRVLGTIFGAAVILLWVVVAAATARGAYSGEIFRAPCLVNLKVEPQQAPRDGAETETAPDGLDMLSK